MIIAVDFDGTLCRNKYPAIGRPNRRVIRRALRRQRRGDVLILWTCRSGRQLAEAVEWSAAQGLRFDYVNENTRENLAAFGGTDNRKIYADEYWDDKAKRVKLWQMKRR